MKKLLTALSLILLMLLSVTACAETQTVNLPDQSVTVRVYGSTTVERTPNTVIRSFTSDRNVAWTYPSGAVSGDKSGTTTAVLKEYDGEKDILYVTKVNITVLPLDKSVDYQRDQSANSTALQQYVTLNGHIFPVGMKYSFRMDYTVDGKSVPVTYSSSNPEIASIDQNGMVTMKSAGTALLSAYCDAKQTGMTLPITVYSSNTGGSMWGYYEPEDPGSTTKVYAKPDKSSKVLYTISKYNVLDQDGSEVDLIMHTLEKNEDWCKVTSQLGTGYIPTSELSFSSNKMYDAPALEEGSQVAEQPEDTAFRTYAVGGTVYANDGEPDLYAKPDKQSTKLLTIPVNDPMTVLDEEGSFLKVSYQGKTGYITLHSVSSKPAVEEAQRELSLPATMYVCSILDMPLFSEPVARGRIAEYAPGTPVWVVEKHDEKWAKVEADGKTGYMLLDYLTSVKPDQADAAQEETTATVATEMVVQTGNSGKLYLRDEPGGKILGKYPNGTAIQVTGTKDGWAQVSVEGKTGYMMVKFLQAKASEPAQQPEAEAQPQAPAAAVSIKTVQTGNTNKLNLRKEPRSGAKVITRFPNGTQVEVISALDATWDQVRIGSQTGYMMDRFLTASTAESAPAQPEQPEQPEQTEQPAVSVNKTMVVNTGNDGKLNLRSRKDTRSTSIERYANGTPVTVLETSGGWAKVQVEGRTGYMMTKFLSESYSPAPKQPSESEAQQPDSSASASGTKTVRTGNDGKLNLRSKPGSGAKILGQYPNGTQVEIIDAMNATWDLVRVGGQTGYMMDRYLAN